MPSTTRPRRRAALLLLAAALVAGSLPAGAHDDDVTGDNPDKYGEPHAGWVAPPRGSGRLAPATGSLLGVHPEDSMSGPIDEETQHIITTERSLGRTLDINNSYYGGFDDIAAKYEAGNPNKRGLSHVHYWDKDSGRIPLVGWGCKDTTSKRVASGAEDDVIRKTAAAFKDFGAEIFVRYCWEMDGSKRTSEVGTPEEFIAAWQHIWTVFKEEGVTNVVWVWCANANTFKHKNSKGKHAWDYYPGDEYVDWVSADGYNWGAARRGGDRWRGFVEIFDEFMVWARSTGPSAPAVPGSVFPETFPRKTQVKPIMIGEYGAIEDDDDHQRKAKWMRDTHDVVNGSKPRTEACPWCGIYSDIAALVYFDINADAAHQNGDWRIMSSEESKQAYVEAASSDPWFNQIHTVGWAPAANRSDAPAPGAEDPSDEKPAPDPGGGGDTTPAPTGSSGTVARSGYWMLGADGKIHPFGDAKSHGDAPIPPGAGAPFMTAAADIEPTPSGAGYWVVDSAGSVFALGDANHFGGVGGHRLDEGEKITSLSATPTGKGYWIFTSRGRVFTFGDAVSRGDMSKAVLNGPVLDSIPTPSGQGYFMVASDGGIFAFGDAAFYGSMGDTPLNAPVQSLVPDPDGTGYWLVASDGGIFAFEAPFRGSMGDKKLNKPVTGMVAFGNGYLMVGEDGGIFNFSDRDFLGSLGARPPDAPIVAVAVLG